LKKKYLYAEGFAKLVLTDIFKKRKLEKAELFTANYFSNVILINNGNWNFTLKELPWEAQLTPYRDAAIADVNNDNRPDILLAEIFIQTIFKWENMMAIMERFNK
jgi:hypothetical protein